MSATEEQLQAQYRLRFSPVQKMRADVWQVLVRDYFQSHIDREGSVLDLGCGWGEFINAVEAKNKFAIDLNPDSERAVSADTRFFRQDCSQEWPIPSDRLDVVFSSNFLEHLPDKTALDRSLSEAKRCLRPGGAIICMGPNVRVLNGRYWDFYDHHVALSDRSLNEALELAGFKVDRVVPRFLPYTMSSRKLIPLKALSLYLKLPLLWPIFGEQFLVFASRPKA